MLKRLIFRVREPNGHQAFVKSELVTQLARTILGLVFQCRVGAVTGCFREKNDVRCLLENTVDSCNEKNMMIINKT